MYPKLTQLELELLHMVVEEVRKFGKAKAPSYRGMVPWWREVVDAVFEDDEKDQPVEVAFFEPASKVRTLH